MIQIYYPILASFISINLVSFAIYFSKSELLSRSTSHLFRVSVGISVLSLAPLVNIILDLGPNYVFLVNIVMIFGSIAGVVGATIIIVYLNKQLEIPFSRRRTQFLLIVSTVIISGTITGLRFTWYTDHWNVNRGNFEELSMVYCGGIYVIYELSRAFIKVSRSLIHINRMIYYFYPISWVLSIVVLYLQEALKQEAGYLYYLPVSIGHVIFALVIFKSKTILFMPPKHLTQSNFEYFNLQLSSPMILVENRKIFYFNNYFAEKTGIDHSFLDQDISAVFRDLEVYLTIPVIDLPEDLFDLESFIAEIKFIDNYGLERLARIEKMTRQDLTFEIIIIQEKSRISRLKEVSSEIFQDLVSSDVESRLLTFDTFTRSLTHDISNVLQTIKFITYTMKQNSEERHYNLFPISINKIDKNVNQISELLDNLREFSKFQSAPKSTINLCELVEEFLETLFPPPNIKVVTRIIDEPLYIYGNSVQIKQILNNLTTNAIEALQDANHDNPNLILEINLDIYNMIQPDETMETLAQIQVRDNGIPIPTEIADRIFELNVSSKKHDGTPRGIGLHNVFSIVEHHNGFISISNNLTNEFKEFDIYLRTVN